MNWHDSISPALMERLGHPLPVSGGRNADSEVRFNCPFCSGLDVKFHLYYNFRKGLFNCYRCGAAGKDGTRSGLLDRLGISKGSTVSGFHDFIRGYLEPGSEKTCLNSVVRNIGLPVDKDGALAVVPMDRGLDAWDYLIGRGISEDAILRHEPMVGIAEAVFQLDNGSIKGANLRGRILFIDRDNEGKILWWGSRTYRNSRLKFYNPPYEKGASVFGLALCPQDCAIIVESAIDAMVLSPSGVAGWSKQISEDQVNVLVRRGFKKFVAALDGDAIHLNLKLAHDLWARGAAVDVAFFPVGSDPSELGSERSFRLVNEAAPYHPTRILADVLERSWLR